MKIDGLDEKDNKILKIIEKNARLSYSQIGEIVGLSRVAVKNRMEQMEERNIIQGYHTIINATSASEGRKFYIDISTEANSFNQVIETLVKFDVIRKVEAMTGECRIHAEGFAPNRSSYETFMKNAKLQLKGLRCFTIQDVQFAYKDLDGGVEYERTCEAGNEGN